MLASLLAHRDLWLAALLDRTIREEVWGGEVWVCEDQEEIDRALGTGRDEYGIVTVWSD